MIVNGTCKLAGFRLRKLGELRLFAVGGFDWAVENALGASQSQLSAIFGLQHVPWLARWEVRHMLLDLAA